METSEDQEPEAVTGLEMRTFDLTRKYEKLLTEQSIFHDEFGFVPWEVSESPNEEGRVARSGATPEELFGEGKQKEQEPLDPSYKKPLSLPKTSSAYLPMAFASHATRR